MIPGLRNEDHATVSVDLLRQDSRRPLTIWKNLPEGSNGQVGSLAHPALAQFRSRPLSGQTHSHSIGKEHLKSFTSFLYTKLYKTLTGGCTYDLGSQ